MKRQVSVGGLAKKNNNLYVICNEINLIYVININAGDVSFFDDMPDEEYTKGNLYSGISIEDNFLALIPQNARKLWLYDFNLKKWEGIEISNYISEDKSDKFIGGKILCGKVYLFGYVYQGILVFDLEKRKFYNLFDGKKIESAFWGKSTVDFDNKIYIPFRSGKNIVCINAKDNSFKILEMLVDEEKIDNANDGIAYNGKDFFILQNHGNYLYKYKMDSMAETVYFSSEYDRTYSYFNAIECVGDKILLTGPKLPNYMFDINAPDDSIFINEIITYAKYFPNIGLFICKKGKIQLCDSHLSVLREYKLEIDSTELDVYFSKARLGKSLVVENEIYNIKEMIKLLIKG